MSYYSEHKEEILLKKKEYYQKNKTKILARANKRYAEKKESILLSMREKYPEKREEMLPKMRAWRQKNKVKQREYKAKYRERNGCANRKLEYAIRCGKIKRTPCEICGAEPAQAHHDDYNRPLDVRFLCQKCHAEWHRNNEPIRLK